MIAALAIALLMQIHPPSTGDVLATPTPAATLDPKFAEHPSKQDLKEGEHLFDVHCASCHGLNIQGTSQAPPLVQTDAAMVDFQLRTGRMPAQVPFEQEYQKPPMFTEQQNEDIVDYVMTKSAGKKDLPPIDPKPWDKTTAGVLRRGRAVYAENCEQCHAATAHGNGVGYLDVAPSLMDASSVQIAEAVRTGPDVMPVFGPKIISDHDLNDLITYVHYLQNAKYNPGGLQLANWGPVSEGFMAWTFGIGLLVLLVRRIGSTD